LLFSDQHKASVLGSEGHPDAITPNLDRLAAEGVRFSRAYCQDGISVPSRCSMMSGLYPRALGCLTNWDRTPVMREVVPLQKALQANGYLTAAFGKRHLVLACDDGWDVAASHMHGESPDDNYVAWVEAAGHGGAFAHDWAAEFGRGPKGGSAEHADIPFALMATRPSRLPDDLTMEAFTARRTVGFLEQQKGSELPFFCWSSFYRPHQPYTPLAGYLERFPHDRWGSGVRNGDAIRMPDTLEQAAGELPPMLQDWHRGANRVWRLDEARADPQLYRDYVAAYYALVMEIDDHVGAILAALERFGLREDTIVIYTADHGDFVGSHGMVEKCAPGHNVYEDTLRVPLIVSWPGRLRRGAVSSDLAELVDLYPTLMELCGCQTPASPYELQGRSLAGTLLDGRPTGRDYSVSENWSQAAVITERYKLGEWLAPRDAGHADFREWGDMLFDLEADPFETRNLIAELPEVAERLAARLREWECRTPRPRGLVEVRDGP
jgi:arylsulfatase A-like enzyme